MASWRQIGRGGGLRASDAAHRLQAVRLASDRRAIRCSTSKLSSNGGVVHLELAWSLAHWDAPAASAIIEARAAMALFERLGARAYVDRTAAFLRRLGDSERPRGPSSSTAATSLTAREADVLDLVRRGLTNAQIGERLYVSPKTADQHVNSVLGKFGAHSRAETAALSLVAGT